MTDLLYKILITIFDEERLKYMVNEHSDITLTFLKLMAAISAIIVGIFVAVILIFVPYIATVIATIAGLAVLGAILWPVGKWFYLYKKAPKGIDKKFESDIFEASKEHKGK